MNASMILSFERDINDPLITFCPATLLARGDRNANIIKLTVMDGNAPADLSGNTAVVLFQRPGDSYVVRCPGSVSGNVISVTLLGDCYLYAGQYYASLILNADGFARTMLRLAGHIESNGDGPIIDPTGTIPGYEDIARIYAELEASLGRSDAATDSANAAAQNANEKAALADAAAQGAEASAGEADAAAGRANAAAESVEGLTISETVVEYGAGVSASVTQDPESGALHVAIQTERGPQGPGYTIKGPAYATVEALEAAVPSPDVGDQYNVGTAAPYNVYRWTGAGWEDQGKIQGPPGQDGADAAAPRMLSFSLPASGWAGSGPYACAISESSATANTAVVECVLTAATRANQIVDIDWTTSAGSIALSTAVKPAGELAGYMILTEVQ